MALGKFFSPLRNVAKAEIWAFSPHKPVTGPVGASPGQDVTEDKFVFQYWPETLTDTKAVEYAVKQVPGGSHPLYQWVRGGERTLAFTAVFSRDANPTDTDIVQQADLYNRDINAAVWALRRFLYPAYGEGDLKAFPPEFLVLNLPGTAIGGFNDNGPVTTINCLMSRCDVEYRSWFPDGTPRFVTVDLEFQEVVQGPPTDPAWIRFVDRNSFAAAWNSYKEGLLRKASGVNLQTVIQLPRGSYPMTPGQGL
jgi:hypothetical protein